MFENYNPPTVVVVLIPWTASSLVAIKRTDNSGWALPGGFQEKGETWQQAGVREVKEETGIDIAPGELSLVDVVTVEDGKINLLFCQAAPSRHRSGVLPDFAENIEAFDMMLIQSGRSLIFPAHAEAANRYFIADAQAYYR
jgi:ADP-ribose pyrophosphatase YjhB (NUDIX family)